MYLHKKDFSITGKTFVEEYTIPSHIAKSSLGEIKLFNYLDEKYGYIGRIKILDSYEVQK